MPVRLQSAIALFTCGCLVSVAASPSSVGFVVTNGQAHVDGSVIHGNSTLFQGSFVQAGSATSDLIFPGGSNLLLQPESAVKVYGEYAVLQNGAVIQRGTRGLVADGLRISSLSSQGAIVVGMKDKSHLEVAAQGGPAEVRTAAGALVARLETGKAMSFTVQDSSQTPAATQQTPSPTTSGPASPEPGTQLTLHGIVRKDHAGRYGHYLLTDVATKVTYELQGPGLDELVGAQVEVIGSIFDQPAAEGASRVLSVSDIHQMPLSELPGATTATAPPATPPAASVPAPPTEPTAPAPVSPSPEVAANPEAQPAPDASTAPAIPPLPTHSNTPKILLIVALAAGAVVGVALGLGGGKSSTVSPA
jgi:hypothetical protein